MYERTEIQELNVFFSKIHPSYEGNKLMSMFSKDSFSVSSGRYDNTSNHTEKT